MTEETLREIEDRAQTRLCHGLRYCPISRQDPHVYTSRPRGYRPSAWSDLRAGYTSAYLRGSEFEGKPAACCESGRSGDFVPTARSGLSAPRRSTAGGASPGENRAKRVMPLQIRTFHNCGRFRQKAGHMLTCRLIAGQSGDASGHNLIYSGFKPSLPTFAVRSGGFRRLGALAR